MLPPLPNAVAKIYTSTGKLVTSKNLSRYRNLFNYKLNSGDYDVTVTYGKPSITETTKANLAFSKILIYSITINI